MTRNLFLIYPIATLSGLILCSSFCYSREENTQTTHKNTKQQLLVPHKKYLNLEEAICLACKHNGNLHFAELEYKKAKIETRIALGQLIPNVLAQLSHSAIGSFSSQIPGAHNTHWEVFARWSLSNILSDVSQYKNSREMLVAQECTTLHAYREILFSVFESYYNALYSQERISIEKKRLEGTQLNFEQTQKGVEKGDYAEQTALQAQAIYLNAITSFQNFESQAEIGRSNLKALLGLSACDGLPKLQNTEDLQADPCMMSLEEALCYGETHRPDLTSLTYVINAQKIKVKSAKIFSRVDLSVDVKAGERSRPGTYNFYDMQLNLSIPIFTGYKREKEAAKEAIILEQLEETYQQKIKDIQAEIKIAHNKLLTAFVQLEMAKQALNAGNKYYNLFFEANLNGKASFGDVNFAIDTLATSEMNWLNANRDASIAKVRFLLSIGKNLPYENLCKNCFTKF